MNRSFLGTLLLSHLVLIGSCPAGDVRVFLTTADLTKKWSAEPTLAWKPTEPSEPRDRSIRRVVIDPSVRHQTILGMGSSLEPTTCFNIAQLAEDDQQEVVRQLVDPVDGAGMNLMRICIGTPDFTGDPWYSYADLPEGQTDADLASFSIERDRKYILPVLKRVQTARPDGLFFASPWSPPGWMKTTGTMIGGRLKREWFPAYAQYFVKFVQAYEAEGIPIHAVTVQNEPGVDRSLETDPKWFYPSCRWAAEDERDFIRDHLAPALEEANLSTKIWCYDHNYNTSETPDGDDPGLAYPRTILKDPVAERLVSGVAFHGYAGKPADMSLFHKEFPDKPIHFTEGSVFGLFGAVKLIAILENWATSYNAWVTMTDTDGAPNNGPFPADTTCIQRDLATNKPRYNLDFFLMGQVMKFVPRGSVRIGSNSPDRVAHIAFRRPDGSIALVLVNPAAGGRTVRVIVGRESFDYQLPGTAMATLVWSASGQGDDE